MKFFLATLLSVQLAVACSPPPLQIWYPSSSGDPLFRFERDGKVGFIDTAGKIVIEPTLARDVNGSFHDGLLSLSYSKGPFIDVTGRETINAEFSTAFDFSDGLAAAFGEKPNYLGYIDRAGTWAISPQFLHLGGAVYPFSEGFAVVEVSGKAAGYIGRSGEFAIPQQFLSASSFSDGLARVLVSGPCVNGDPNQMRTPCDALQVYPAGSWESRSSLPRCRWSYIDTTGKRSFTAAFEDAGDFHEGLAAVKIAGRWGFIDKLGVTVIPPVYRDASSFAEGLAFVDDGNTSGYINARGQFQFGAKERGYFSEGFAIIGNSETGYLFVDKTGQQAIPGTFKAATNFVHGLAHVKLSQPPNGESEFAYIDHTGKRIFSYRGRL